MMTLVAIRFRYIFPLSEKCLRLLLAGIVLSALLLLTSSGLALAHGEYVSSDPDEDAMLTKAPTTISVHFSEPLTAAGSNIRVYDINGKQVSTADATLAPKDATTMKVAIKPDKSEIYVVDWYNVSAAEGHHDSGSFRFFVNVNPMLKAMLANKSASNSSNQMSQSSTNQESHTAQQGHMQASNHSTTGSIMLPLWLSGLIGLLGCIIGGCLTLAFIHRPTTQRQQPPTRTNVPPTIQV